MYIVISYLSIPSDQVSIQACDHVLRSDVYVVGSL